ncbi:Serine/threonine-protein kinase NLK [Armadillidium vulgare]|nr:Serine/threonine-protein kinase NLK [Armadillidium vulgare]
MLTFFKHENALSALDIFKPLNIDFFQEIYVITELIQRHLHKIIVSSQHLTADHVKVFINKILEASKIFTLPE